MVLFIIVAEEVLETYNVADTATADMKNPDAVTVMFNNLQGSTRDWIRAQKEVAPNVLRSPRVFKDISMAKYFGGDTPFEGYATLYQVKQKEGQKVRDFGVTLTMHGIYLGRRQASVIPKKKDYLTQRKLGQQGERRRADVREVGGKEIIRETRRDDAHVSYIYCYQR